MGVKSWWADRRSGGTQILERASSQPAKLPERSGLEYGIGPGGLTEANQGVGASTRSDRRGQLAELYEAYLACPWSWAAVNAIARTITAGGLVTDWDQDTGEGDQDEPDKPAEVLLMEQMLAYCNPSENIRQILRGVITDLLVFGDAYLEVVYVGSQPVALYSLDCPSMLPIADQHGRITKYVQVTDLGQRAEFEPRDVIHISLDAPRSSVFGVSPTQAALLPITGWLFAAATSKEIFRKGNPPQLHVDMPAAVSQPDINRWTAQFMTRNVGPRNIGMPVVTKGGATVNELAPSRTVDYLAYLDQKRDEILAAYGVPPAKAGVIESGHLGGGTGEAQDRTFMVNTCQPLAELVLEALNFNLARLGFGVTGWKLKFREVDMRDSKTVEDIRDMRIRNGLWTLNRARVEIGEPPVDGGDDAVLVDRQNLVQWRDMDSMSKATIAAKLKGTVLEPGEPAPGEATTLHKADPPEPTPPQLLPGQPPPGAPADPAAATNGSGPADTAGDDARRTESYRALYRARLREALATLPDTVHEHAA